LDNCAGLPCFSSFPARIFFMLLSQASFAAVFWLRGKASPWKAAGAWWTVWGTLVDVGCLACLFFLTRRGSLRIRDLLGPLPRWLVPKGIAWFVLIFRSSFWAALSPVGSSITPGKRQCLREKREVDTCLSGAFSIPF
jgi:hypothetical protein